MLLHDLDMGATKAGMTNWVEKLHGSEVKHKLHRKILDHPREPQLRPKNTPELWENRGIENNTPFIIFVQIYILFMLLIKSNNIIILVHVHLCPSACIHLYTVYFHYCVQITSRLNYTRKST